MQQLQLFDYRTDYLFESENQIASYYDVLNETKNEIKYSEHIDPKKGYAICGMEYEEYVDVKKDKLNGLTYDDILVFLNGVCLTPTTDYSISGTTMTLVGGAPPAGSNLVVRYLPLTG